MSHTLTWPGAVAVSAVLDAVLAEPPPSWHPVVWLGRYLSVAERWLPAEPPVRALGCGGLAWSVGLGITMVTAAVADRAISRCREPWRTLALGVALWPLWSGRLLLDEVDAVAAGLDVSLAEGRHRLARIVSRDPTGLAAHEVTASAIESLAENLSDSVVAPLWWFAVGGLPAAAGYRFVNTADARWGYRTPRWDHAGRVAARADDVANLMASRLTGAMIMFGAPGRSWRDWPAQARGTSSPNSGWPMAAMALRLGTRLAKPGGYVLHPAGRSPGRADTERALRIARRVLVTGVVMAAIAAGLRGASWQR